VVPVRFALDGLSAWKGLFSGDGGYFLSILKAHFGVFAWLFTHGFRYIFSGSSIGGLHGMTNKNMVWEHFVRGRKHFAEIFPSTPKK